MKGAGRTGTALVLVALLLSYAGSFGAPALAQYDVAPPAEQYGAPAEEPYDPLAPATVPEDQYDAPPEDGGGAGGDTEGDAGGDTSGTVPAEGDNEEDEGVNEAGRTPDRPSPGDGGLPGYLDGVLLDGFVLLAVASVIATLVLLADRFKDRLGL
ncbi:hypothetical protein GBA65_01645 [Rubrobacter marinus]|uniref:Uncharacterized protein n=1 Tax=Rubrobacter marinus TaxID=2653852 RepID=A0A6G8PSX1_9ACTN|nr:hypothetical protein [Rubrobacter marinus]QIN77423.1 hypothetical protein GBA65_01645 [Rubrobacter marinus]